MKTLFITIALLSGSFLLKAQENKTSEKQDDIQNIKDAKALELKMLKKKDDQKIVNQSSKLASEQGIEPHKISSGSNVKSGNLLPNTVSTEELLVSIPGRKKNIAQSGVKTSQTSGLSNKATLEEIKKTIPKN